MFWLSIAFYILYIYIYYYYYSYYSIYIYIYGISMVFFIRRIVVQQRHLEHTIRKYSRSRALLSRFEWIVHLCCSLDICVVSHRVSITYIYIWPILTESHIILYTSLSSSTVYLFIKTMLCYYARDILYRLCTVIVIIIIITPFKYYIFGISSSINHISRGEIDTRERENSQPARMKPILVYHYELDIPLNHVCYEETRSVHEISAEFSTLSLSLVFFSPYI